MFVLQITITPASSSLSAALPLSAPLAAPLAAAPLPAPLPAPRGCSLAAAATGYVTASVGDFSLLPSD